MIRLPIHPLLISSFQVVYLAKANFNHIDPEDILRPLGFALLFTVFVMGLVFLILRELNQAALVTSLANMRDRAGILNAYYVHQDCQDDLYPSISPINTFRVLFNCQFNGDLELLDDITWYGEYGYLPIEEVIPGFYE